MSSPIPIVRSEDEGEERWFYGGGIHRWKATSAETNGAFILFEDRVESGKTTPLHSHPDADETLYVLAGRIVVSIDDCEHTVGEGGMAFAPRGTPHAFLVTSPGTRVLTLQTPGHAEAFFIDASTPMINHQPGTVDLGRVQASAAHNGGTDLLGPPPFAVG